MTSYRMKSRFTASILLCLGVSLTAWCSPDAPIEYNPGCSVANLIANINSANSSSAPAIINLEDDCDYVLTQNYATDSQQTRWGDDIVSGLPAISSEITIRGNSIPIGFATITVDGYSFGHFFITPQGNLRLSNLFLRNGNRGSGSAIYNEQGHLHASDVRFVGNSINMDDGSYWHGGGAIFNDSGRVMILESGFRENGVDTRAGGAIYNLNGFLHVEDTYFHYNVSRRGGAIHIERTDPEAGHEGVLIYNSSFHQNSADDSGGAIDAQGENTIFYIEGTSFTNNKTWNLGGSGGAINLRNSSLSLSINTFEDNSSKYGGAVFNHEGSHLTISDSQFQGNRGWIYGGGVLNAWGDVEIDNSTFSGNESSRGGGIYSTDHLEIRRSVIDNNTAAFGAGVGLAAEPDGPSSWCDYLDDCPTSNDDLQAIVTESTIEFNDAYEVGGGFYVSGGDLTLDKCTVHANSTGDSAGGIHLGTGNLTLTNTTITGNTADSGGGLNLTVNGEAEITHSTIAYNSGDGLRAFDSISLQNTIVAWNQPNDCVLLLGPGLITATGENLDTDGSCGAISRSIYDPQLDSTLADNGGPTQTHALLPGSIAIDLAPDCGGLGEDQRWVSRPQGDDCDIGAYEYLTVEAASEPRCAIFSNLDMSAVLLDIPPGSSDLTVYVRMPEGVPGLEAPVPGDQDPWDYTAFLGNTQASECSYQGYAARVYCTFDPPSTTIGSILPLHVYVNGCDEPIFSDPNVSIYPVFPSDEESPGEPGISCSAGLGAGECAEAGGSYSCGGASACSCVCP